MRQEAVRRPYLVYLIAMVAAVGGFLFGYDLAIISGAMVFMKKEYGLTPDQVGSATASALLGCMLGPILGGLFADRLGRRLTLIAAGLCFAFGALGTALPYAAADSIATFIRSRAPSWLGDRTAAFATPLFVFNLFRVLGGTGVGLASVVSPMFIAEMSPPRIRGALVTINQLAIVVGLASSVVVSWYLAYGEHWRWMFASNAAPVPLLILGLLLVPESPRWLAQKNRTAQARHVLTLIDGPENADREIRDILGSNQEAGRLRELFRPGVRFALAVACSLAVFQQITGASILLMYMPSVFQMAGFTNAQDAIGANVVISLWNVFCTVMAMLLVDRLGRRPLLLLGTAGMALGLGLVGLFSHLGGPTPSQATGVCVVVMMFIAVGSYLVSLAPLTWLIMSEIFPNRLRGKAMAIGSVSVWTASYLTARYFPPMADHFRTTYGTPAMAYWIFAVVSIVAFFFSWFVVPETKGRTLEELGASWGKRFH